MVGDKFFCGAAHPRPNGTFGAGSLRSWFIRLGLTPRSQAEVAVDVLAREEVAGAQGRKSSNLRFVRHQKRSLIPNGHWCFNPWWQPGSGADAVGAATRSQLDRALAGDP